MNMRRFRLSLHSRLSGRIALTLVALSLLLFAACGVRTGADSGTAVATSSATAPALTASQTASERSTVSPTPAPSSGTGQMRLIPGAAHYAPSDTITVTIHNGTGATVYALAHSTDCSVILIQRFLAGAWQPVHPCVGGFPHPVVTEIGAGATTTVNLPPMAPGSDAQPGVSPQWAAGTYRAALMYTSSRSATLSGGQVILSSAFVVG